MWNLSECALEETEAHALRRRVWSCNEWDRLEEVIVGNPRNARYPYVDRSTIAAEYGDKPPHEIPNGPFPEKIIEEAEEDLCHLIDLFVRLGIKVKRPETWMHDAEIATPFWKTSGYYNYCPRDIFLVVGDMIIETPNIIRGRFLESYSYREILVDYLRSGGKWISAPKPMLQDTLFEAGSPIPLEHEPVFDAANIIRLGRDLLYLVSSTGNELGAQWLQTILGRDFRVHPCRLDYHGSHIDTSVIALRPGLLLCNPERVRKELLPESFRKWDIIYSPPMVANVPLDDEYEARCIGTKWIDLNLFSISPDLVVVDRDQVALIKLLERNGIDVAPVKIRHARLMGGGAHCVTLDVKREGTLESYFE